MDLRAAAGRTIAPEVVHRHRSPEAETWVLDAIFTFHSNEPDVTFECKVDPFGYEPCGFEARRVHVAGRLRVGPRGDRGRPAHLLRPRDRLRGQRRQPGHLHLAPARRASRPSPTAPASRPARRRSIRPPAARSPSTTATIDFIANVADATFECSLDLEPFAAVHLAGDLHRPARRRAPAARDRDRLASGVTEAGAGRVRVGDRRGRRRDPARDHDRAGAGRPAAARRSSSSPAPTT